MVPSATSSESSSSLSCATPPVRSSSYREPVSAPDVLLSSLDAQLDEAENMENGSLDEVKNRNRQQTDGGKRITVPAPSILDYMTEGEIKRLTKANTRKNIGDNRKSFRTQLNRICRRLDNMEFDETTYLIVPPRQPPEHDTCTTTSSKANALTQVARRLNDSSKRFPATPRRSAPKMLSELSSPVTPPTANSSANPFQNDRVCPAAIRTPTGRYSSPISLSANNVNDDDDDDDDDEDDNNNLHNQPDTKAVGKSYDDNNADGNDIHVHEEDMKQKLAEETCNTGNTGRSHKSSLTKAARLVRIRSRLKMGDYFKARSSSAIESPRQCGEESEMQQQAVSGMKKFLRSSSTHSDGVSPIHGDKTANSFRSSAISLFSPQVKMASVLGMKKKGAVSTTSQNLIVPPTHLASPQGRQAPDVSSVCSGATKK